MYKRIDVYIEILAGKCASSACGILVVTFSFGSLFSQIFPIPTESLPSHTSLDKKLVPLSSSQFQLIGTNLKRDRLGNSIVVIFLRLADASLLLSRMNRATSPLFHTAC